MTNNSTENNEYTVRSSLIDQNKQVAATNSKKIKLEASTSLSVDQDVSLTNVHLWNGVSDPYLYELVVELIDNSGKIIDKSVQQCGIRQIKFDADNGLYLNGNPYRLNGVNVHQDALGKAWAVSDKDVDE
ncbi:hypothetical protein [uncultured Acinetobacter sp.]|uniref:hypothetical protein n=1 Tax=uncultured Acinetobacter sp. TaxID=165433 RepID=UPI0025858F5D|nr:hypothetical protein [uncultured Acinetobacter sp.]